ncbi:MAG TPA: BamA/TamA family outer membrane protein [Candidatus Binatia bacterium]|nr:BamA/TamA family outer membrane protein [Candidatus Binatia bacterium]
MGPRELRRALSVALAAGILLVAGVAAAGTSFIPIPEIVTDPNEGNTFGLLGVVLFTDQNDQIRYMLAPDATYNKTKGFFPTFRFFGYPTNTRRYSIVAGKSTTKDEDYEGEYLDRGLWDGRAFLRARAIYERDSTERFFGFGNDSDEDRESNYTGVNTLAEASPGAWLLPNVNVSYRMRIRRFATEKGQVSGIPALATEHPEVRGRGLETGVYWAHQVALAYDSRDDYDIPTKGALALVYTEAADRALGSSTSFVKFGGEVRKFQPLRQVWRFRPLLALRALADYTSGDRATPFWEQSSLGGRRTLRGFGSDRFIDFNRSLASAELRTGVYQRRLFGVNAELEVSPFIETGQVFRHLSDSPVDSLHTVYGVGFRGVVRPQIVGFVDIGRGSEGTAIFTGVNYPF